MSSAVDKKRSGLNCYCDQSSNARPFCARSVLHPFMDSKQLLFNTSWRYKTSAATGFCAERSLDVGTVLPWSFSRGVWAEFCILLLSMLPGTRSWGAPACLPVILGAVQVDQHRQMEASSMMTWEPTSSESNKHA